MRKMKNRFWKTGILLIGISLLLSNCKSDDELTLSENGIVTNSIYKVPEILKVKSNFEVFETKHKIYNKNHKSITSKNNEGIFIDWDNSKKYNFKTKENINILYTPILYNKKDYRMKSLLASVENEGVIESFIFTLIFDEYSTNNVFSGLIYKHDIEGNFVKVYKYTNGVKICEGISISNLSNKIKNISNRDTPNDIPSLTDCFNGLSADDLVWMAESGFDLNTMLDCIEIAGSSGSTNTEDNSWSDPDFNLSYSLGDLLLATNNDTNNTSTNGTSTSNIVTTNINTSTAPIDDTWYSAENPKDTQLAIKVIENNLTLSNDQIKWVNNPNNAWNVISIYNFFKTNGYSQEAKDVAIIAINTNSVKYINQNFNFTKKSPFNVDMTKVLDSISLPERDSTKIANEKFLCIYEKLTASNTYKDLFTNIFGGSQDVLNIEFKVTKDLKNDDERVNGLFSTLPGSLRDSLTGKVIKLNALIEIDEDLLLSNSTFNATKTILHESIHAYLTLKQLDCNRTASFNTYNNNDLCQTINSYYNNFNCSANNTGQHEFMFDLMLPTFNSVFNEIGKENLTSQASINGLSTYDLQILNQLIGTNISNSQMFNWDEFYNYFMMQGLNSTDSFETEIKGNLEKYELFKAYKWLAKNKLSTGCN